MKKFVPKNKQSKKNQSQMNAQSRGSWGILKPVTRVIQSKKLYSRHAEKELVRNDMNTEP